MSSTTPQQHLVLDVLPFHAADAFDRVLVAARSIGLVGAMLDHPDARATGAALVAVACDASGRPLVAVDGEAQGIDPIELVEDLRRRIAGAVRLTRIDGTLVAESVLSAAVERWQDPPPRRWASTIASAADRQPEMQAAADGLGARIVQVELDGRTLLVMETDRAVAWQPQDRPVIGLSIAEASIVLEVHAEASRMGDRRTRGLRAIALADLALGWGPAPTPLVVDPSPSIATLQDEVVDANAPSMDDDATQQTRRVMEALGRGAHTDSLLALAIEPLRDDTAVRLVAMLGVPEALVLAATGEVEVERMPGAVVHEPSARRARRQVAAFVVGVLVVAAGGAWLGWRIATLIDPSWRVAVVGTVVGGGLAICGWALALRRARIL